MDGILRWTAGIIALSLAGCGGGGGGGSGQSGGEGTVYEVVPPVPGVTRIYAETVVDNSNDTIQIGYSETVESVQSDGGYVTDVQSTTGASTIVDGTNYAVATQSETVDASGQELSYTYHAASGAAVTCTYDPHASGPDFPVQVGLSWQIEFTLSCSDGSASIVYAQQGTVADVESVTVPAGTYTALKLESTLDWTDANGTERTESITNWRDTKTLYSVKQQIHIEVSGTVPASGYAVSRTIELESISGGN